MSLVSKLRVPINQELHRTNIAVNSKPLNLCSYISPWHLHSRVTVCWTMMNLVSYFTIQNKSESKYSPSRHIGTPTDYHLWHCPDTFWLVFCISKIWLCHWEPLEVSESCQTGITGRSNPRVDWTNTVAFRYIRVHLGAPATRLGVPTTSLRVPGSTDDKPGTTMNHCRAIWEKQHLLWEHRRCTWKS
jgi:hypothetical protein